MIVAPAFFYILLYGFLVLFCEHVAMEVAVVYYIHAGNMRCAP